MRFWFLFLATLTGCVAAPAATPTFVTPVCGCEPTVFPTDTTEPPILELGSAWSYEGTLLYQGKVAFTVIVADVGPDDYLFAGSSRDDVAFSATWGSGWYGTRSPTLNTDERMWFSWPLEDGKSWEFWKGLTVRATATDSGFAIQGANDRYAVRYDYAPALGAITNYERKVGEHVEEQLRLVATSRETTATWYDPPEPIYVDDATAPATFDLPAGFDNVILSAGGENGGFAAVAPPGSPAWTAHFPGPGGSQGSWTLATLPATPGTWGASVTGAGLPLTTWSVLMISPVKWRELSLAPTS